MGIYPQKNRRKPFCHSVPVECLQIPRYLYPLLESRVRIPKIRNILRTYGVPPASILPAHYMYIPNRTCVRIRKIILNRLKDPAPGAACIFANDNIAVSFNLFD